MAEGRDVHDIGVPWIDADLGDRLGVVETDVRPCLASVRAAIHTVALHDVAAKFRFAHSDVDHIRIGLGDGNGAD